MFTIIQDRRVKVAAGLLLAVFASLASAQARAEAVATVRYACDARQRLIVERSSSNAQVRFIDRTYALRREPSSLGEKYLSPTAALIVDGRSAFFVAEDRFQLGACLEEDEDGR